MYPAYNHVRGKINIFPDKTVTIAFNPKGDIDIFYKSDFSKYNDTDNAEFLEGLIGDYLVISATGQTVKYSEVFAARYFKNIRFDVRIGKQHLIRLYTELTCVHFPNSTFAVKQSNDSQCPIIRVNFSGNIFESILFQIQLSNTDPKFHIRSIVKSGYTSIILGGKQVTTDETFHTAGLLDNLLASFYPETTMPAFQINSLIDTLVQHLEQLSPAVRDQYLTTSTSTAFVFSNEDIQFIAYMKGVTSVTQYLYQYVCQTVAAQSGYDMESLFNRAPNDQFLPPKAIQFVLNALAELLHCDIFIHPCDTAAAKCTERPPSIDFHVTKNETGTFANVSVVQNTHTVMANNNDNPPQNSSDINGMTEEAVRTILLLNANSVGLPTENETDKATPMSLNSLDLLTSEPQVGSPMPTHNTTIESSNLPDMPSPSESIKPSKCSGNDASFTADMTQPNVCSPTAMIGERNTVEFGNDIEMRTSPTKGNTTNYQPHTEIVSDDDDVEQDAPSSAPKQRKIIETSAEKSWYRHVDKSLQTRTDFVQFLQDTLEKQQTDIMSFFKNQELQLLKISKSINFLQSFYDDNITIATNPGSSNSSQGILESSMENIHKHIPRHKLKRNNNKKRKNHSL